VHEQKCANAVCIFLSSTFKKVIGFIHNVISECNITIVSPNENDSGGFHIRSLSNNKSKLIELNLNAKNFEYFTCDEPKISIGVDIYQLHYLLNLFGDDESIILYMKKNKHTLCIKNINGNKKIKTDLLNLEDLNGEMQIPMPQNKITMKSSEFHTVCGIFRRVHIDYINISLINNKILFESINDCGKVKISYDSINPTKNNYSGTICNMYETQELINISNCDKLCDTIDIYMQKDFPLVLDMTLPMLGKMYIFITPCEQKK
jgi:DNA polymerase III sliding clamp (beta) subunit (PCNA family)